MKFLSTLIKHSLQPAVQSDTFHAAPMVNSVPNQLHLNKTRDNHPGSDSPEPTHGTGQHGDTPQVADPLMTPRTQQQPAHRQNSFQNSVATGKSATLESAQHLEIIDPQPPGIPSHKTTTAAPHTISSATDTPVFNPKATPAQQPSTGGNRENKSRREEQTQANSIDQTVAYSASRQTVDISSPIETTDFGQTIERPDPVHDPINQETQFVTQPPLQSSDHASAFPTGTSPVPEIVAHQPKRQARENISPAPSVFQPQSSSTEQATVERVTTSTPPQVRIGHINVLIEDQAAAAKPRKSATAKTATPSIPFGIRGL